jgi:hypothetical protein
MTNTTNVRAHDDLAAILSQVNPDDGATAHGIASVFDATFTWDYGKGQRPALDKLYEKAIQERVTTDWSTMSIERTGRELPTTAGCSTYGRRRRAGPPLAARREPAEHARRTWRTGLAIGEYASSHRASSRLSDRRDTATR